MTVTKVLIVKYLDGILNIQNVDWYTPNDKTMCRSNSTPILMQVRKAYKYNKS